MQKDAAENYANYWQKKHAHLSELVDHIGSIGSKSNTAKPAKNPVETGEPHHLGFFKTLYKLTSDPCCSVQFYRDGRDKPEGVRTIRCRGNWVDRLANPEGANHYLRFIGKTWTECLNQAAQVKEGTGQ